MQQRSRLNAEVRWIQATIIILHQTLTKSVHRFHYSQDRKMYSLGFTLCLVCACLAITAAAQEGDQPAEATKKGKRAAGAQPIDLLASAQAHMEKKGKRAAGARPEDLIGSAQAFIDKKGKRSIDEGKEVLVKARQVMGGPMGGMPVDINGYAAVPMQAPQPQTVIVQQQEQKPQSPYGSGNSHGAWGSLFQVFFG